MASVNIQISTGTDDAEEFVGAGSFFADGEVVNNSSDLEICYDTDEDNDSQLVGVRFQNVTIPQGSTINSAVVRFVVDAVRTSTFTVDIWGDDSDNPSGFPNDAGTPSHNISNRTSTTATVSWNVGGSGAAINTVVDTTDISTIVQEIVNRVGWSSGNAMVIIFGNPSGTTPREFESYDGEAGDAARLVIDYTEPATGIASLRQLVGHGQGTR